MNLACLDIVIPIKYRALADEAPFGCCLLVLLIAVTFFVDNQFRVAIVDFKELRKDRAAANCATWGIPLAVAAVASLF